MEDNHSLIEYIFESSSLELIIDTENQSISVGDYDQLSHKLFTEISELKKRIFNMYIKGEDLMLKRIREKLVDTRNTLASFDFFININVESHDFKAHVEAEKVKTVNQIKVQYLDELISVIDNFSFATAHFPLIKSPFKTNYTVEELAYFFKLTIEQGIIQLDKNQKTKFFEFIASNFQSKDMEQISANSLRNKSYDPSLPAIERIREDLLQMLQLTRVHKDTDKIQWKK